MEAVNFKISGLEQNERVQEKLYANKLNFKQQNCSVFKIYTIYIYIYNTSIWDSTMASTIY